MMAKNRLAVRGLSGRNCHIVSDAEGRKVLIQEIRSDEVVDYVDSLNHYASRILTKLSIPHPEYRGTTPDRRGVCYLYLPIQDMAQAVEEKKYKACSKVIEHLIPQLRKFYDFPVHSGLQFIPDLDETLVDYCRHLKAYGPVMQHNDINLTNILFDPGGAQIFLVDNESVGISFAGRDYSSIIIDPQSEFNSDEIEKLLEVVSGQLERNLLVEALVQETVRKVNFFKKTKSHKYCAGIVLQKSGMAMEILQDCVAQDFLRSFS